MGLSAVVSVASSLLDVVSTGGDEEAGGSRLDGRLAVAASAGCDRPRFDRDPRDVDFGPVAESLLDGASASDW
jgi:hypothetical protein